MEKINSYNPLGSFQEHNEEKNLLLDGDTVQSIIFALTYQHNAMIDDFNKTKDEDEMHFLTIEITKAREIIEELENQFGRKWIND